MAFLNALKGGFNAMRASGYAAAPQAMKWAGRGAMGGAIAGGAYGAFSDNTSILGGAFKGAMLGGVGGFAGPAAMRGWQGGMGGMRGASGLWNKAKAFAGGAGKAGWNRLSNDGRNSAGFIGRTARRGYNTFSGLY